MPAPRTRDDILRSIPSGATRVQVVDATGKTRFRKIADIEKSDELVLNGRSEPIIMAGSPGRKKRLDLTPVSEAVGEILEAKEEYLRDDDLLGVVRDNPEKSIVLDQVMEGLAEEAASLAFERREADRKGQPTSAISLRRIGALKAVGDTYLKRLELVTSQGMDLDSPAFRRLFAYIMETFKEAMLDAGTRREQVETVFASFSKKIDSEWQKEATKKMMEG